MVSVPGYCALQKSKYRSLKVRAGSTIVIIASFIIVIYLGHIPLMMMILAIQVPINHHGCMHLRGVKSWHLDECLL